MKATFSRAIMIGVAAGILLAGCGGLQVPVGTAREVPENYSSADADRGGSWMALEAKSEDLLYVSEFSEVVVYSYPQLKRVGTLRGFDSTVGLCVDGKGDVFATNQIPARVFEFAHGGTKRIATLKIGIHQGRDDLLPVSCAVDPTTGDLAVAGFSKHINVFKNARGKPLLYTDSHFYFLQSCGYDPYGDLFIAGWKSSKAKPGFAELSKGSHKVININLDTPIYPDGGVQWDGKHVAVFAFDPPKHGDPVIYQFAINGTEGTKVGTTRLGAPSYLISQFFIFGKNLIAPNWYGRSDQYFDVLFFNYPAGGTPYMTISKQVYKPRGVVISVPRA